MLLSPNLTRPAQLLECCKWRQETLRASWGGFMTSKLQETYRTYAGAAHARLPKSPQFTRSEPQLPGPSAERHAALCAWLLLLRQLRGSWPQGSSGCPLA